MKDVATEEIWTAVETAIRGGMTPREFKAEVLNAWHQAAADHAKDTQREAREAFGQ